MLKKRICKILTLCLIGIISICCGSDPLTREIERAAADPGTRNADTYRRMERIVLGSPARYANLIGPDGKIVPARLQEAVDRIGRAADPAFSWDISVYGSGLRGPLRLTLMLERSGSMTGYDSRGGSGNFKRALNELLNRFPAAGGESRILIVNDGVYPFSGTTGSFMRDKDIFASTAGTGNPAFTDFGRIFDVLLSDTAAGNIHVLATDLIYSPKDAGGLTPEKIFNESESLVSDIFRRHPDKEAVIIRLVTDYHGRYYPYTSPSGGVEYSGRRPYFLLVTGTRPAMSEMFGSKEYASFADFTSLPGYTAHYRMTREAGEPPYYTVLPRRRDAEGRYVPSGASGNDGAAHGLSEARPGRNGRLVFEVAADLRATPLDSASLVDKSNYEVEGAGNPRLLDVRQVGRGDVNVRNKRYIGEASHILTIEADIAAAGNGVRVRVLNRLPGWIGRWSSTSDTNINSPGFPDSTFGLAPLVEGIYRALYGTVRVPAYTVMNIDIKK